MPFLSTNYTDIKNDLAAGNIIIVAVSKTKPKEDIEEAYKNGVRDFGENYVQEMVEKHDLLPGDIRWHFIGHLQTNKVKFIIPFVYMIHGVDSEKLLAEIDKQAFKTGRIVHCLLQVHIAEEETKFGFDEKEIKAIDPGLYKNVVVCGLMGMASFSSDTIKIKNEFNKLNILFKQLQGSFDRFTILSMGMSGDYKIAVEEGSNMVRIGSLLFGDR